MNKHLPGLHNQKAHGRAGFGDLAGFIDELSKQGFRTSGSTAVKDGPGVLRIGAMAIELSQPPYIQLVTTIPVDKVNYSKGRIAFIADTLNSIQNAARTAGYHHIWSRVYILPVMAFAKPGYRLQDTFGNTNKAAYIQSIEQAVNFLKKKYDLQAPSAIKVEQLADQLSTSIHNEQMTVSDYLNTKHPDYPEVDLFREYLAQREPYVHESNKPRPHDVLDDLFAVKDL